MTTYTISGSTGNDGNAGTVASPFATIMQGVNLANPGDTVQVRAGTYVGDATGGYLVSSGRNGAAGAPITLKGYPGERPIISMPNGGIAAVQINGSYWNFSGFEMVGNAQSINLADAKTRAAASTPGQPQDHLIVSSGVVIGYNGPLVHHVNVSDVIAHDFPGAGIAGNTVDYISITGCQVYRNAWYSPYGCSGISLYGCKDFDSNTGYKCFVTGNYVWGNDQLVGSYSFPGATGSISDGEGINFDSNNVNAYGGRTLCANNRTAHNGSAAYLCYNGKHVDFINNSSYQDGTRNSAANFTQAADCRMMNMILYAAAGGTSMSQDAASISGGCVTDFNIYWGGNTGKIGSSDIVADPRMTNPGGNDFTLLSGSPAIGAGTANYAPVITTDYAGNARPAGRPDIGAYQFQGGVLVPVRRSGLISVF